MKQMELSLAAKQIAGNHIRHNKSMIDGITKIAKDRSLNDEQIKRLVEESNKEAFMAGFEKDGSQIFEVASFNEVKEAMAVKMEKVADIKIDNIEFSDTQHKEMLGNWKSEVLEKVASELEISEDDKIVIKSLIKLAHDFGEVSKEIQNLTTMGYRRYNSTDHDYLIKTAEVHKDTSLLKLASLIKQSKDLENKYNYIFEKYAGIDGLAFKALGKSIAGTANVIGTVGASVATPVAKMVAENPGRALNAAFMGPMVAGGIKHSSHVKNLTEKKFTGPLAKDLVKTAGFMHGLQNTIDMIAGAGMGIGGPLGGLLGAAAKKLGGGVALTMNNREFDRSFDTIMSRNPDLQDRQEQMREYFDVLTRHSPTIAKDPIVAENMVKNFDALGGIDFNTIKSMNEMEAKKDQSKRLFN